MLRAVLLSYCLVFVEVTFVIINFAHSKEITDFPNYSFSLSLFEAIRSQRPLQLQIEFPLLDHPKFLLFVHRRLQLFV